MHLSNLAQLLDEAERRHGRDRPCLIDHRVMTYGEVASKARRLAAWMRRSGVRRGDRIMIITMNRPEVGIAAFAAARLGAAFTVLHNSIRGYGLGKIVDQVEPAVVLLDETTGHLSDQFGEARIVWAGGGGKPEAIPALDEAGEEYWGCDGIDLDPVCLIYTSGSTGAPRGVTLHHDNILFVIDAIQERLGYRPDDTIGVFLPLSFDYGLYQIFLAVQVGAAAFIGRPEMAGPECLNVLKSRKITVLPGVPTLFAGMLKLLGRGGHELPHLRSLTNTGARLPLAHIEQLRRHLPGASIYPMYGLTECKRVSIMRPEELESKPDSVGRPLAGTECSIAGEDGQTLPPGEVGELVVRGRHVALGYWRAEAETRERYRPDTNGLGRVLYSGDACYMDEDGFLYFVARKDALIKRHGFRVHPAEIEEAACSVAGVVEAGVVQIAENDRLHLFITTAGPHIKAHPVLVELSQKLEPFKVPDQVHVLAEMPKTRNGKVDRKELEAFLTRKTDQ